MTEGHFVRWCHCWCEHIEGVSSVLQHAWKSCLVRSLHALSRGLNISRTLNEKPLLGTHNGIYHHVRPWTMTQKWGITLIVGTKSTVSYVCLSSCWLDSYGLTRPECMHVHSCLIICVHGWVSVCCLCELLHVSSWHQGWTLWPCPCKAERRACFVPARLP